MLYTLTLSVTCSLGTNWISQAIDILFEQTDFFPIVKIKAWLFFVLSKTVISLFCSQNYWKLISNTALYGAQIYKPFLNAINGAIERTQNEKKGIFGIFGHSLFLFFQKKQMRYPSSLSSSIQKSPWNLFIVIHIPSWNGFQLFPKAVGKSFVSSNKKSAIFVQLLLKSPQICEFLTACSANLKKMCINSNNEMSWKKWALYYRLHCTAKDIKSVPHTASCVRE